jgi:hypothetical protein
LIDRVRVLAAWRTDLYQGIGNTFVQLFRFQASGVIGSSQPIPSDVRNRQMLTGGITWLEANKKANSPRPVEVVLAQIWLYADVIPQMFISLRRRFSKGVTAMKSILVWYRILRTHHHWAVFQAVRYAMWLAR